MTVRFVKIGFAEHWSISVAVDRPAAKEASGTARSRLLLLFLPWLPN
jgi:hypothetical protein